MLAKQCCTLWLPWQVSWEVSTPTFSFMRGLACWGTCSPCVQQPSFKLRRTGPPSAGEVSCLHAGTRASIWAISLAHKLEAPFSPLSTICGSGSSSCYAQFTSWLRFFNSSSLSKTLLMSVSLLIQKISKSCKHRLKLSWLMKLQES